MDKKRNNSLNTLAVFAARYAHNRPTAAAFAMLVSLRNYNDELSDDVKKQIVQESYEATCNHDDWEKIRELLGGGEDE